MDIKLASARSRSKEEAMYLNDMLHSIKAGVITDT